VTPEDPAPPDSVEVAFAGNAAHAPMQLFITAVNGVPLPVPVRHERRRAGGLRDDRADPGGDATADVTIIAASTGEPPGQLGGGPSLVQHAKKRPRRVKMKARRA